MPLHQNSGCKEPKVFDPQPIIATVSEFRKLLNTFTLWSSKLGLLWVREGWWQGF